MNVNVQSAKNGAVCGQRVVTLHLQTGYSYRKSGDFDVLLHRKKTRSIPDRSPSGVKLCLS